MDDVLLVDDDDSVLRAYKKVLTLGGFQVETATNGNQALEKLRHGSFAAIVSDVSMPQMGGLDFLRAVREQDQDVPVILMTGTPALDSAIRAVGYGAFSYLVKPVDASVLNETVVRATKLHALAKLKREAMELVGAGAVRPGERAALDARFSLGLGQMWMAFQPIVTWRDRCVFGYEALLRSDAPEMKTPGEILDAAERLGLLHRLGRKIRGEVARVASDASPSAKLFVNLHSADLNDDELAMLVVVEGIETSGERDKLVELGCDLFQGYLFAKPERGFKPPLW